MNTTAGWRKRGSIRPSLLLAKELQQLCPRGLFPRVFCMTFALMRGSTPPPFKIPRMISYPIMRHAASHEHHVIRALGLEGLGTIGNTKALPILESAIEDDDAQVKASAIGAIAGFRSDASWAILERCIDHHDQLVRLAAIRSIGRRRISDPDRALAVLSPAAQHPDVEVQKIAIYWMSETRSLKHEQLLCLKRCLNSENELVRAMAAIGLEKKGNGADLPDTIPHLVQGLLLEAGRDVSGRFRAPLANDQYGPYTYVARQVIRCLKARPESEWVKHEAILSAMPALKSLALNGVQYSHDLRWLLERVHASTNPSEGA